MVRVTVMMRVRIRNRFSRFILRLLLVVRENMRMFRGGGMSYIRRVRLQSRGCGAAMRLLLLLMMMMLLPMVM